MIPSFDKIRCSTCFISLSLPIFILILTLAGCTISKEHLDAFDETKQELASTLQVTKLPISVQIVVDDKTRNWVVSKRPSSLLSGNVIYSLPVGQQFLKGVQQIAGIVFGQVCSPDISACQTRLSVRIANFYIEHAWDARYLFGPIDCTYEMTMTVETELISEDGEKIYSNKLDAKTKGTEFATNGWGGVDNTEKILSRGLVNLIALWSRKFSQDIAQSQQALSFAKSSGGVDFITKSIGPEVIITSPDNNTETEQGEVLLRGHVISERPIKKSTISLNGRPLEDTRGVILVPKNARQIPIKRKILLPIGENIITVTATDEMGKIAQKVIRIVRFEPELFTETLLTRTSKVGERFALVVGISKYKHAEKGIPNLENAAKDACKFAQFLKSPKGGGFDEKNVLLLTDELATSSAMRKGLFTFLKRAIEEDLVFFFFSGQGTPEPGMIDNYYLLTYDADPASLPSTAIPTWEVNTAFQRNIKAKRAVLFVDACHISGIGKMTEVRNINMNMINKYIRRLSEVGEGMAVFTATQDGETAVVQQYKERDTGLFTHHLLEALTGAADDNSDGVVTLGEAVDYTIDVVSAVTRGKQRPQVGGKFDRNLPLSVLK